MMQLYNTLEFHNRASRLVPQLSLQIMPDSFEAKNIHNLPRKNSLYEAPTTQETQFQRCFTLDYRATQCQSPRAADYLKYLIDQAATQRFENEFDILGKLGKGGFASVYRVMNRLDQVCYAVKKISLKVPKNQEKFEKELTKMLREVRHLAKARHSNIVGYNQAWIEVTRSRMPSNDEFVMPDDSSEDSNPEDTENESNSLSGIEMVGLDEEEKIQPQINKVKCQSSGLFDGIEKISLYIQMEICEDTLEAYLQKRNRNFKKNQYSLVTEKERAKVKQIIEGLHYVHHSANLIHRDLKPSNIFITHNVLKIGDFGLATNLEGELPFAFIRSPFLTAVEAPTDLEDGPFFEVNSENSEDDFMVKVVQSTEPGFIEAGSLPNFQNPLENLAKPSCHSENGENIGSFTPSQIIQLSKRSGCCEHIDSPNRTGNIGTRTYAAPEQLKGKSYGQKADIFSLGLILIELFCPFKTNMERIDVLHKSKHGKLPNQFVKACPKEAGIIRRMLSLNPLERPSISELRDMFNNGEICEGDSRNSPLMSSMMSYDVPSLSKSKSASPKSLDEEGFEMRVSVREDDEESYSGRYLSLQNGSLKFRKNKNSTKACRIYKLEEILVQQVQYQGQFAQNTNSPLNRESEASTQNSTNTYLSQSPENRSPVIQQSPPRYPKILGFMLQESSSAQTSTLLLEPPLLRVLKIEHEELDTLYVRLAEEEFSLDSPAESKFERLLSLLTQHSSLLSR